MHFPSPTVKTLYRAVTSGKTFKPEKWSFTYEEAMQVGQCVHDSGKIKTESVQENLIKMGLKKNACAYFKTHVPAPPPKPVPQDPPKPLLEPVEAPKTEAKEEEVRDVPMEVEKRARPRSEVEKEIASIKREIRKLNGGDGVIELRKKLKILKMELNSCM